MNDALKIMDEIERGQQDARYEDGGVVTVLTEEWQSLRAAIERQQADLQDAEHRLEAQAEALRLSKKGHENAEYRASMCADALHEANEKLAQAKENRLPDDYVAIPQAEWQHMVDTEQELELAQARIAQLESLILHPYVGSEGWRNEAHIVINESKEQSLAAIKAAALREVANDIADGYDEDVDVVTWLWEEARSIEHEAGKGES